MTTTTISVSAKIALTDSPWGLASVDVEDNMNGKIIVFVGWWAMLLSALYFLWHLTKG